MQPETQKRACTKCGSPGPFYRCAKVKDGRSSWCKACFRAYREDHNVKNPQAKERHRLLSRIRDEADRDDVLARARRYQARHRERYLQSQKDSRIRHADRIRVNNNARARHKRRPAWANQFFIKEIYRLAQLRTRMIGVKHVVDHVIPIKHPLVCGLHVETNLRVVPELVNARKGNSFSIQ